jgi:hypothetical protein
MAMEHEPKKLKASTSETQVDSKLDLDALLHPATAFARPLDVVRDPDLTFNEKRLVTRDNNGATTRNGHAANRIMVPAQLRWDYEKSR